MSFRAFNQKFMEPGFMWLMIFGLAALCQPWIGVLHEWSVTIMLVGLVGFLVAMHIRAPDPDQEPDIDETGEAVSVRQAVGGDDHG